MADLDTKTAIKRLGSEKLFWAVLGDYYKAIDKKAQAIQDAVERSDWAWYTTEVHALKSTSRQIGADELADLAAKLECAGNARDINTIKQETGDLLEQYLRYASILKPYFSEGEKSEKKKEKISKELLEECIDRMQEAITNLDMLEMEEILDEIGEFELEEPYSSICEKLNEAVEVYDADACESILNEMKK